MKIIYRQTPMNNKKKQRTCTRCGHIFANGENYYIYKKDVICQSCIQEDEYISGIKIFKGSKEIFWHNGIAWNIEGILKDIEAGRRFEEVRIPLEEMRGVNQGITIVPEHIEEVDLKKPGIYASFRDGKYKILDGHHRIEKGLKVGKNDMEFYKLSFKEHFEYIIFMDEKNLRGYLEQEMGE